MTNENDIEIPQITFSTDGELVIAASDTSSPDDFDFFVGKWKLRNRKLRSRLDGCMGWDEFESTQEMYKILNGLGNIDNFLTTIDGQPFEGMTVRLFDPQTRLWNTSDPPAKVGSHSLIGCFANTSGAIPARPECQRR